MGLLGQRRADRRDFDLKHTSIIFLLPLLAVDVILSQSDSFVK